MRLPLMACIVATTGVTFFAATRSIDAMAISQADPNAQVQDLAAKAEQAQAQARSAEKIAALEAANATQTADHAKLVSELAQARADFGALQTQHEALMQTNATLQASSATSDAVASDWDQKLAESQSRIDGLMANLDASTAQIKTLEAELASAKLEAARASKRIVALETAAATTRQTMPSAAELAALNAALVTKDAALDTSAVRINALTKVLERNGNRARAETARAASLETRLSEMEGKVAAVTQTLAERDSEITQLRASLGPDPQAIVASCTARTENLLSQGTITFKTGTSRLDQASVTLVEQLSEVAQACVEQDMFVTIGGHTDSLGGEVTNQELSKKRAAEIVKVFTESGVNPASLRVVGYGESQPIADNDTSEGRAANRRITFEWQPV